MKSEHKISFAPKYQNKHDIIYYFIKKKRKSILQYLYCKHCKGLSWSLSKPGKRQEIYLKKYKYIYLLATDNSLKYNSLKCVTRRINYKSEWIIVVVSPRRPRPWRGPDIVRNLLSLCYWCDVTPDQPNRIEHSVSRFFFLFPSLFHALSNATIKTTATTGRAVDARRRRTVGSVAMRRNPVRKRR